MAELVAAPPSDFHTLSITSVLLHRVAVLDPETGNLTWESEERRLVALRAGLVASAVLTLAYALLFWRRRSMRPDPGRSACCSS